MREVPLHFRQVECPVCGRRTLVGYAFDLPEQQIGYDAHFLQTAPEAGQPPADYIADTLALFNNYLCTEDLYVYTGNVTPREGGHDLDENVFYELRRFVRHDQPDSMGRRVRFFLLALFRNGLDPRLLIPADPAHPQGVEIRRRVAALIAACQSEATVAREIGRTFFTLCRELSWNPFAALAHESYKNGPLMAAMLELQLADLIFLLRRSMGRGAEPPTYGELYEALERLRQMLRGPAVLNADLLGDILFECLKLARFVHGPRVRALLETAYEVTAYLTEMNLRVGADLNRKLHVLARNADVVFCLHIVLGRELAIENPTEAALLRFLRRRLSLIGDYAHPGETPESLRIARIGRELARRVERLAQTGKPGQPGGQRNPGAGRSEE